MNPSKLYSKGSEIVVGLKRIGRTYDASSPCQQQVEQLATDITEASVRNLDTNSSH